MGTFVVLLVLVVLVGLVIYGLRRDKKRGKTSCGSGCGSCAMRGQCHRQAASNK